jgi:drug/metabolite transporter (DMT)-like permease
VSGEAGGARADDASRRSDDDVAQADVASPIAGDDVSPAGAQPEPSGRLARAPSPTVVVLLLALLCVVWGSTWLVIKQGLEDLPPFLGVGLRFCLAGVVMALVAPAIRRREGGSVPTLGLTLVVAIAEFGVSYGIVYRAETVVASGLVAVLWAVYPLLMAACGHVALPGERLPARAWVGFGAGFVGVALLFATDLAATGPEAWGWGAAVIFGAAVVALGTTILKKHGHGVSSALLNRNGMLVTGPLFLVCWWLTERELPVRFTGQAVFSIVYLAIMGTVITFGVYFWLLRHVAAFRLSLIAYVIPLVALAMGAVWGDEQVGGSTLVGTGLILLGVAAGARGSAVGPEERAPGGD